MMTTTDTGEQRLDVWLARERSITRHAAQVLIGAGCVTVNGRLGRAGQRVRAHDVVKTSTPRDQSTREPTEPEGASRRGDEGDRGFGVRGRSPSGAAPLSTRLAARSDGVPARLRDAPSTPVPFIADTGGSVMLALHIVYEDESLAIVDKPAGMVVHPAPGHHSGTLADMLRERGTTWSLLGGQDRPGIVHRLDRDTSGLLVVAKTEAAHRSLAAQLKSRTLGRTYLAVVRGGFREETGTIDAPIARDRRDRKRMAVVDGGREAVTDFRVLERFGDASMLEVSLRTGRTHQIRVHLAYISHPIIGDTVYGKADAQLHRPALHAARLRLVHPVDGSLRSFESPLPDDVETLLTRLRLGRR